jgi:hypothetical protein
MPHISIHLLCLAFVAGFFAVIIFHQPMLSLLHALGMTPARAYPTGPTAPLGVPLVISLAFWGGVWGIIFVLLSARARFGPRWYIASVLFGAIVVTAVAWFVVAPLKGQAVAAGWNPARMAIGPLVNGAWGLGLACLLHLLDRITPGRAEARDGLQAAGMR